MKLLHITDIHFGPYHWLADDDLVLQRLNAVDADIVLNTGDMTSDSLQVEFQAAQDFLGKLTCKNVISIMGNHDKYSKRSHEMFRQYIFDAPVIRPKDVANIKKTKLFISPASANLDDYFTDVNYLRLVDIDGVKVLFVCVDSTLFQNDTGYVDVQILDALSDQIAKISHDRALMLTHHSLLATDADPLINSKRVSDFILQHRIEATFCGHTHELDIVRLTDLARGGSFRQFMCGTLASVNVPRDTNMFCVYENFGAPNEIITVTRMIPTDDGLEFVETVLGAT